MSEKKRDFTVEFLKLIGHSSILKIFDLLKEGEKTSSVIENKLDRAQSTVSEHLNKLVDYNLITFERRGKRKYYKIRNMQIINLIDRVKLMATEINKLKFKDIRDADVEDTLS
ncbi:hypothetical protein LCGC14_2476830 [marine sediment metagenome]|uniref:HTH arsR-type domain-containing protein n=1 Tax=marine sediment metagenome TaxID=412755 RepID=A0A0F9B8P7_9ZZZZ